MDSMKDKKALEREAISQQTKQFLKQGGRIKKIPKGQSSHAPVSKNMTINKSKIIDRVWSNASMTLRKE
jgi:hypothetical protein